MRQIFLCIKIPLFSSQKYELNVYANSYFLQIKKERYLYIDICLYIFVPYIIYIFFVTFHRNFENYKLQTSSCKLLSISTFYLHCRNVRSFIASLDYEQSICKLLTFG